MLVIVNVQLGFLTLTWTFGTLQLLECMGGAETNEPIHAAPPYLSVACARHKK